MVPSLRRSYLSISISPQPSAPLVVFGAALASARVVVVFVVLVVVLVVVVFDSAVVSDVPVVTLAPFSGLSAAVDIFAAAVASFPKLLILLSLRNIKKKYRGNG